MLLRAVVVLALTLALLGILVPFLLWRKFPTRRKRQQRLVDLVSYLITLIALGTGLLSIRKFESTWEDSIARQKVAEVFIDAQFDNVQDLISTCAADRPNSAKGAIRADCAGISDYVTKQTGVMPGTMPGLLPYPNGSDIKQPEIKALTDRITGRIATANKAETNYLTKRQTLPDPTEGTSPSFAIPLLALALGLGIGRRIPDARQDWNA